jgi:hypothetical protein
LKILLAGSLKDNEKDIENLGLKYDEKLKILCVWVGIHDVGNDNWNPITTKIKQVLNLWSKRNLTIFGRTQIVKTLALAKL